MFRKIENKNEWEDLLRRVRFKTFFHSPEWENFLEKEFSWLRFDRYIWRDELVLSVARCKLFGKEKVVSHPLCEYGGPLLLKEGIDWEGFTGDFKKEFGPKARIKFHPYIFGSSGERYCSPTHSRPASAGLRGSGCFAPSGTMPKQPSNPLENITALLARDVSTFWIEDFSKKSSENLWGSLRKTLRQEIKKGEGFSEVRECQNESELKQFYNIYLSTVKRHRNIPLPFSVFEFFRKYLCAGLNPAHENDVRGSTPHINARIFLTKKDGRVVGGSVFLFYQPFIHYFISASDEKFREENIGHQILWHVMQKYAGGEYDYFDLGGTRKGSSLEVFKRGWGAKEYPIYEIGAGRISAGNLYLRNMLGVIPSVIMRRLSPVVLWTKI